MQPTCTCSRHVPFVIVGLLLWWGLDPPFNAVFGLATMASKKSKNGPPDLGSCVRILHSLSKDLHLKPPKIIAELYVAALGLIYHLKLDRTKLENTK